MFQAIIHEGIEVIEGLVVCGFGIHARDCNRQINRVQEERNKGYNDVYRKSEKIHSSPHTYTIEGFANYFLLSFNICTVFQKKFHDF